MSLSPKKSDENEKQIAYHLREISKLLQKKNAMKSTSENYSLFPIKDELSYQFFKTQEAAVWSSNEMDFVRDKTDYQNLTLAEKKLIDMILGFFAPGDGLISQNILFRFLLECETYEEMSAFISQLFIELVHAETYGLMIATLLPTEEERNRVFQMCNEHVYLKKKTEWMEKYMYSDEPKPIRLAAFAIAEGLFFTILFVIIFWFRSRGILQTLIFSNEQISKDERLHRDFGCMLFKRYDGSLYKTKVLEMIREAVEIECEFIESLLPDPIKELNKEDLKIYCTIVADNLLVEMSFDGIWHATLPKSLSWVVDTALNQKSNFFEVTVGSYKQHSLKDALDWKKRVGWETNPVDPIGNPEDIEF